MNCGDCHTEVYMTRYGLYEVDRYVHHYCLEQVPPALDTEQFDVCACGVAYVRINRGERLNLDRMTPHVCVPVEPEKPPRMPDPPRQASVEPPAMKPWRVIP